MEFYFGGIGGNEDLSPGGGVGGVGRRGAVGILGVPCFDAAGGAGGGGDGVGVVVGEAGWIGVRHWL